MKKFYFAVLCCFFLINAKMQAQTDCVDAIVICGDANLSGLDINGFGVQEIFFNNACSSQENNSLWLKVKINQGGTFGFVITPGLTDLVVDYDFWVYGPNVDCGNIGMAIRCSTTNPLDAGLSYNTTGMNGTETDASEGPGPDGNAFIQWLTVQDNETYYIVVDRPVGISNFSIAWTGTATFYQIPTVENLATLHACELANFPGSAIFDLYQNAVNAIGTQTNVAATFYTSYKDAFSKSNVIGNPALFQNATNPQTIYIRLENTVTGCFIVDQFDLVVDLPSEPNTNFTYDTPICNLSPNPAPIIDSGFSPGGVFSATPEGLAINSTNGEVDLSGSHSGKYTITYSISLDNPNCFLPKTQHFDIEVEGCMIPRGISPNDDGLNDSFDIANFNVKELVIFNRYGTKVYHKLNYKKEWYGLSDKGQVLPDAVYFYVITFRDGSKKTGWVYINRQH